MTFMVSKSPPTERPKTRVRPADEPLLGPKSSRRRVSHISRACNSCRLRKTKCDGGQPSCAICKVYREDCVYTPEQDGRRSTPKAYVASLETRVRSLESILKSHGISPSAVDEAAEDKDKRVLKPVNHGSDRLKIDEETGQLVECGHTSVFKHPESAPATPSNHAGPSNSRVIRAAVLTPTKEESSLPSPELDQATHDEVLRLFFDYFNPQCMWVHEKEFRTDLRTAPVVDGTVIRPQQSAYYSPMLHNIILAIGVSFLQIDHHVRDRLRAAFSRRAKDLFEDEVESAMLSTVSGVLLLGTYHAIVARQNLGFVYAGVGFRLVQALGLGTSCSYWVNNGSISDETRQYRYKMFYSAYILDKCWSTYVGRSASIVLSNYDIPVPAPDPEEDEVLWHPIMETKVTYSFDPITKDLVANMSALPRQPVKSWRSTTWVWMCKLSIITERVLGTVYSTSFDTRSNNIRHIVSELDTALNQWNESLPEALRLPEADDDEAIVPSHILNLHAFYNFTVILLHRPWFAQLQSGQQDTLTDNSVGKCEKAASKIVNIITIHRRCPGLQYSTVQLSQIVFSAGTVHLLSARNAIKQSRKAKSSFESVQACISALKEMGTTMQCSVTSASSLQRLLSETTNPGSFKQTAPAPKKTAPGQPADVENLLKDPTIQEQLKKLGWAPPPTTTDAKMRTEMAHHGFVPFPVQSTSAAPAQTSTPPDNNPWWGDMLNAQIFHSMPAPNPNRPPETLSPLEVLAHATASASNSNSSAAGSGLEAATSIDTSALLDINAMFNAGVAPGGVDPPAGGSSSAWSSWPWAYNSNLPRE